MESRGGVGERHRTDGETHTDSHTLARAHTRTHTHTHTHSLSLSLAHTRIHHTRLVPFRWHLQLAQRDGKYHVCAGRRGPGHVI